MYYYMCYLAIKTTTEPTPHNDPGGGKMRVRRQHTKCNLHSVLQSSVCTVWGGACGGSWMCSDSGEVYEHS